MRQELHLVVATKSIQARWNGQRERTKGDLIVLAKILTREQSFRTKNSRANKVDQFLDFNHCLSGKIKKVAWHLKPRR